MINSHSIKLTGSFEIPGPIDIDKNYELTVSADITSISKESNDDGSFNYIYKAKAITGEASNGEEVIKFKDNKSQSKKLRGQMWAIAQQKGIDGNEFYEKQMILIRHHLPEILSFIEIRERI